LPKPWAGSKGSWERLQAGNRRRKRVAPLASSSSRNLRVFLLWTLGRGSVKVRSRCEPLGILRVSLPSAITLLPSCSCHRNKVLGRSSKVSLKSSIKRLTFSPEKKRLSYCRTKAASGLNASLWATQSGLDSSRLPPSTTVHGEMPLTP